jgi:hypothetical protein
MNLSKQIKLMVFLWSIILLSFFLIQPSVFGQVTKRLYTVGNSLTDGVSHAGLQQLAESRGNTHIWGKMAVPGATLGDIWWTQTWNGVTQSPFSYPTNAFVNYQWDAITLQPFFLGMADDINYIGKYVNVPNTINAGTQFYIYMQYPVMPNPYTAWASCPVCDGASWNTLWARISAQSSQSKAYFEELTIAASAQNAHKKFSHYPCG